MTVVRASERSRCRETWKLYSSEYSRTRRNLASGEFRESSATISPEGPANLTSRPSSVRVASTRRQSRAEASHPTRSRARHSPRGACRTPTLWILPSSLARSGGPKRSEEHTSELQSRQYIVCRLLLEKKKTHI